MYCYLLIDGQFVNGGYFEHLDGGTLDTRVYVATLQTKRGDEKSFCI